MANRNLNSGSFYWVKPVFDVDFTPPGFIPNEFTDALHEESAAHWTQNEQPARFQGFCEDGREQWIYLGQDEPDDDNWWPVCWVGEEIKR